MVSGLKGNLLGNQSVRATVGTGGTDLPNHGHNQLNQD